MSRKNYFKILEQQGFDSEKEFINLQILLDEYEGYNHSLREYIELNFKNYKNRGTFINFNQLEDAIEKEFKAEDTYHNYLFTYSEMLLDIFKDLIEPFSNGITHTFLKKQYQTVIQQISNFLSASNHRIAEIENGSLIIIENNALASQTSEILSDTDPQNAVRILEYNHFSNNGNTDRKKEILLSLAYLLEPKKDYLNNKLKDLYKKSGNRNVLLVSALFEMFNKLQVRHNDGKQYISTDNPQQLEYWYDNIYNTALTVIVSEEQADIHAKFQELKSLKH